MIFFQILIFLEGGEPYWYVPTPTYDHIFVQPSCGPENFPDYMTYNFSLNTSGAYSTARHCFMGDSTTRLALNYTHSFFKTYSLERKFFNIRIISNYEYTSESNRFVDEDLAEFLQKMENDGFLEDTIVMLYSAHGDNVNSFMYNSPNGDTEKMNPFMFMMIPKQLDMRVGKYLKANQQKLVTHHNIFATLMKYWKTEVTPGKDMHDSKSLFEEVIPDDMTCSQALVANNCQCN